MQLINKLFPVSALVSGEKDTLSAWIIVIIISIMIFFLYKLLCKLSKLEKETTNVKYDFSADKIANNPVFGSLWKDYESSFIDTPQGEKTKDSAKNYFSLSNLLQKGTNLGILGAASNILVGIGVLGTFLGLTQGVSGLDMSTPDSIKESIDELLAGIGTAFYTSVWGMFSSLVITLTERRQQTKLRMALHDLCYILDTRYKMTYKDELLMKQKADEVLFERYRSLKTGEQAYLTELFTKYFSYTDESGNQILASNLMRDNHKKLDDIAADMKTLLTDLGDAIVTGVEKILESESLQEILPALQDLKIEIKSLSKDIKSPAESMMDNVIEEIRKMTSILIEDMRDSISDSTKVELKEISSLLAKSSVSLLELPDRIEKMTQNLNNSFDDFKNSVSVVSANAVNQSTESFSEMKDLMDEMSESFKNRVLEMQQSQSIVMGKQAETVNNTDQLLNHIEDVVANLKNLNGDIGNSIKEVAQIQNEVSETSQELASFSDIIRLSSENFLQSQEVYKQYSESFIQENTKALETAKNMIELSSESANDSIDRFKIVQDGLKGIFGQVDDGLRQYQSTVESSIRTYLSSFGESLTSATKSLAAEASRQGDMLEELNEIVSKIKR